MDESLLEEAVHLAAIERLQGAYADVVTRRAWPELDELFLPDCEVVIDTHRGEPIRATGPAAIGAFIDKAIARFEFFEFVILSTRLFLDSPSEARGRLYMCEVRHEIETSRFSEAYGLYHDRYRRVDGRWWFAHRSYQSMARTAAGTGRDLDVFALPTDDFA